MPVHILFIVINKLKVLEIILQPELIYLLCNLKKLHNLIYRLIK
jgi:hypothetical protein